MRRVNVWEVSIRPTSESSRLSCIGCEAICLYATSDRTAEQSYHQALVIAKRQGAQFWELRAALDLARRVSSSTTWLSSADRLARCRSRGRTSRN
jgi:hypothetical protein